MLAMVAPAAAWAQDGAKPTCFFLECGPGDNTTPPPAIDLPPSRQAPTPAAALPRPSMPGEQCTTQGFVSVCASSVLAPWRDVTYGPANMFDNKLDTAWVEGVDGTGAGERLIFEFDTEQTVEGISLLNGYHKSNDLFAKNGRITEIYLDLSDGQQLVAPIADDPGEQVLYFDAPVRIKWLAIEISAATAGSRYADTAISEFRVLLQ